MNVGRLLDLNADDSMKNANKKFEERFRYIENKLKEKGRSITESDLEEMDKYWNEAKMINSKRY